MQVILAHLEFDQEYIAAGHNMSGSAAFTSTIFVSDKLVVRNKHRLISFELYELITG